MVAKKQEIENIIKYFVNNEMLPKFPMENYVIDFVVAPLRENNNQLVPYVVEVNPFAEFAGSGKKKFPAIFYKFKFITEIL